jgi:cell division protein FtsW
MFSFVRRMDVLLLGVTVVLTFFGLAMIASVSVFKSYQLTQTNSLYLWKSSLNILVGFVVMGLASITPYRFWEKWSRVLYVGSIILLMSLFLPGLHEQFGSAQSWLNVGSRSFQPSELLKLTFIIYLSVWLQKREQFIATFQEGFIPFGILLLVSTFLVAIQPDLGSFLVLACIGATMFFIAGGNLFHLAMGASAAALLGLPVILQKEYIRNRFFAFLFPDDPGIRETIGFQIKQALIAIGSGGFFGVGYGKSIQKFGYLPEVQADMIFSAMAEELGFMRLMIVLALYTVLVYRGYRIARLAPDRFGFLLATGITTWIAVQTAINMAVNLGIFPLTGLTLPFISYGGSSLIALMAAVGILLNISAASTPAASAIRRTPRKDPLLARSLFT